jgi:type 1 fimbria pilin
MTQRRGPICMVANVLALVSSVITQSSRPIKVRQIEISGTFAGDSRSVQIEDEPVSVRLGDVGIWGFGLAESVIRSRQFRI